MQSTCTASPASQLSSVLPQYSHLIGRGAEVDVGLSAARQRPPGLQALRLGSAPTVMLNTEMAAVQVDIQ